MRVLDTLSEEELMSILKPILPSKKENWKVAYYVGLRPEVVQKFKTPELLKLYIYSDIEWYYTEHNCIPLVTSIEYMANFLKITEEELSSVIDILIEENLIIAKDVGDGYLTLWPNE